MAKSFSVAFRSFLRGSLAFSALAASGCSVYDEALLNSITDGGGNVTPHCVSGTAGCIPEKPPANTSAPTDAVDMTFALRDVRLSQTDSGLGDMLQPWRYIGFNLDGIETKTTADPNGCLTPPNPDGGGPGEFYPVDGEAGIDNQFGAQLAGTLLPIVAPNMQNTLCCYQYIGRGTLLLRIRDWNGEDDDASVTVSLTTALDGTADDNSTVSYDPTSDRVGYIVSGSGAARTAASLPSWAPGADTWYTSAAEVSGNDLDRPRHVDVNAYVRDGYFVMHLDVTQSVKLFLGAQHGIAIGLRNGTMIAHVSANRHLLDEGWIGGRMGSTELLDASYRLQAENLYSAANGGNNTNACANVSGIITPLLEGFGDVLANGTNSPTTPCDALSAGVSFHGVVAKDVRLAPASLAIPLPDCDGQQAIYGTTLPEEGAMACASLQDSNPPACGIRAWNRMD